MTLNILLYGATGFSGRMIVAEAAARANAAVNAVGDFRMILAARDGGQLRQIAESNGMEFRVFGLDDDSEVQAGIDGADVVINAAGPFALTAGPLVKAALTARCHYVDINGEIDVYMASLDDLGLKATQRGVAMVCAAGYTAGASDILLDAALTGAGGHGGGMLGAVRIAVSRPADLSAGSVATIARLMREQVIVVRWGVGRDQGGKRVPQSVLWHAPVGKLERTFDFGGPPATGKTPEVSGIRIASATSLVDTLAARLTVARHKLGVRAIESYTETGILDRFAYQLGSVLAPVSALPPMQSLARAQSELLFADGPSQKRLQGGAQVLVLEIEDTYYSKLIDWRWKTPDPYQFTAQLVFEVARKVAGCGNRGWVSPAEALGATNLDNDASPAFLRGCQLLRRQG